MWAAARRFVGASGVSNNLFASHIKGSSCLIPGAQQQVRCLNVHEYVSIDLMKKFGINVPAAQVASSPDEAAEAFKALTAKSGDGAVVKAQVLSGGRGLGSFSSGYKGGVHMAANAEEAKSIASKMIGKRLITKQTGANGLPCDKVLLMEKVSIKKEMYLSIMMDRVALGPVIVACADGGTSIEDLAESNPELILKENVSITKGLSEQQASKIATFLKMAPNTPSHDSCKELLMKMYDMFIKTDCTLLEINPLAELTNGIVMACDAKLNFDDSAYFRQKEIFAKRDFSQEDPREVEAYNYDINYIGLEGNIGCMVNGAGLAMATMDLITLKGGAPANFLDVGGGASEDQVVKAFELLNSDEHVKAILVNIFGGIMKCDIIAHGVIAAAKHIGMSKPIVIRLQGTNVDKANKMLDESDVEMTVCGDLDLAAETAVSLAAQR